MPKYELLNPFIVGAKFERSHNADSDLQAAEEYWKRISEYTTNNVPAFAFSIRDDDHNVSHFFVKKK